MLRYTRLKAVVLGALFIGCTGSGGLLLVAGGWHVTLEDGVERDCLGILSRVGVVALGGW